MRRPQFTLKTLLWLMALVAAFLGGAVTGTKIEVMRHELVVGPDVHLNAKGEPAKPGEPVTEVRHTIVPKWTWW